MGLPKKKSTFFSPVCKPGGEDWAVWLAEVWNSMFQHLGARSRGCGKGWSRNSHFKGTGGRRIGTSCCLFGSKFECIFSFKMSLSDTKYYRNCWRNELKVETYSLSFVTWEKWWIFENHLVESKADAPPPLPPVAKAVFLKVGSMILQPQGTLMGVAWK